MGSPLTSQILNALNVRSWVTLLGKVKNLTGTKELHGCPVSPPPPVTFAMVALNGIEEDDWSIEIDADHMDLGQDGFGVFDWSEEADNAPVALALMATSSTDSSNSEGNPEEELKDHAIIDSGCSGSMTGDKDKLSAFNGLQRWKFKIVDENLVHSQSSLKEGCIQSESQKYNSFWRSNMFSCKKLLKMKLFCGTEDGGTRFSWVFFLVYKDETYDILHDLIVGLENKKGIQREYSIARTPQQNGVAERKNRTLIEAARTMLADSLLPIQFWAEAVHTACYVLNRVLVTKPQMKTPYELLMGKSPNISFMKPFGCPLTILNTLDHLGKFEGKSEEGYLLGYSTNNKGFRVYNRVTRKVQDCLHVDFLEDQINQKGKGPDWMFDLDILTPSLNYIPFIVHGSSSFGNKAVSGAITNDAQNKDSDESTVDKEVPFTIEDQDLQKEFENLMLQETIAHTHMENQGVASKKRKEKGKEIYDLSESDDDLPKDGIFDGNSFDDENKDSEEEIDLDLNNMDNTIDVSSSSTLRIHKNHPQSQIIGPTASGVKTRK
ncbi:putative ribonuclease H-like domain-containing protein [Tanacetum coccineum]